MLVDAAIEYTGEELALRCQEVIGRYRSSRIERDDAIAEICAALSDGGGDFATVSAWLGMLDEIDHEVNDAALRGQHGGRAHSGPPDPGTSRPSIFGRLGLDLPAGRPSAYRVPEDDEPDPDDEARAAARLSALKEERDNPSNKLYPWDAGWEDPTKGLELTRQIHYLKSYYTRNITDAGTAIGCDYYAPSFPTSLWPDVLLHKYFNLDRIHSESLGAGRDSKIIQKLSSDVEISIGSSSSAPARRISNSGEWIGAFDQYAEAVTHAYPCRKEELRQYRNHISTSFRAISTYDHQRIINYDIHIRKDVAQTPQRTLLDIAHAAAHQQFFIQHLSTSGVGASGSGSSSGSGKKPAGKSSQASNGSKTKTEPCRRWNDGLCHATADACRYAHICAKCAGAHPSHQCSRT